MKKLSPLFLPFCLAIISCNQSAFNTINTTLPKPTGEYSVGTELIQLTKIIESNDSTVLDNKYLNVQLWYPAKKTSNSFSANYITDSSLIIAFKEEQYLNLSDEVIDSWDTLKTNAFLDAEFENSKGNYPLIILSHGFGMSKTNYSSLSIELASHGYIVASIDHPGSGLTILPNGEKLGLVPNPNGPDGKVIEFCEDASFVASELLRLEKFSNNIDRESLGMIGHSLGGAAALNIGKYDRRFKASINLDGYLFGEAMKTGVETPFLSILQRPGGEISIPDSMKIERRAEWQSIVEKSNVESFVINVRGLMHFDFSDLPFIIPDSIRIKNGGVLSPERGYEILSELIISFFDSHLKSNKAVQFRDAIKRFDEVSFEVIE